MINVSLPIHLFITKLYINGEILTGNELKITDKVVPLFLIGDSAYP